MSFWTPHRFSLLRQLWTEGKSASQIAAIIGDGCTRNQCIGKAHRSGLVARPSPIIRKVIPISLKDIGCQYPHGEPRMEGFHYCGAPRMPGASYCAEHYALTHKKVFHISPEERGRRSKFMRAMMDKRRMERHP